MSKVIVVTGSTRGIGLGLAEEFLKRGHVVIINGRSDKNVQATVKSLQEKYPAERIKGVASDITKFDQVQTLWSQSKEFKGRVDIWINNAGVINDREATWKLAPEDLASTVNINTLGPMYCAKVALSGMLSQGFGHLYNFEGFGSNGKQWQPGMTPYATTKAAMRYFTRALIKETKGTGVKVGTISPGIVVTDLPKEPYKDRPQDWTKAKKIFNILGDHVETVTPWIAERVLEDQKPGTAITWLTGRKAFGRFLKASFVKRDLFKERKA